MGTRERRQRELQAREQLFLETARRLIREEGLMTLQMARLARACDYATGTLYQHFASKEDLLVALATQRLAEHCALLRRVATWSAGTRERMFALTVIDEYFSRRHPSYSKLMQYVSTEVVWESASPERREQLTAEVAPVVAAITGVVEQAIARGDVDPGVLSAEELMLGPWAVCHGMQSLLQARGLLNQLAMATSRRTIYVHAQVLLNGLNWLPLFDIGNEAALDAMVERIERELLA
ncbi:MAG: TetR/AcrR family transcriptional regulator [Wenzhouxiangella sp.]